MTTSAATTLDQPLGQPRDLAMEGHLRAIALWSFLGSAGSALIIVLGITEQLTGASRRAGALEYLAIVGLTVPAVGLGLLGYHLSKFSDGARRAVRVLGRIWLWLTVISGLGSVFMSFGGRDEPQAGVIALTVMRVVATLGWQIGILWVVDSRRAADICTPGYQSIPRETRAPYGFVSPLFWAPMLLLWAIVASLMTAPR